MEQTNENNQQIIKDIRNRIQFLITITVFFLAFVYSFYKAIGSDDSLLNNTSLVWGIGISFCILNYTFVGLFSDTKEKALILIRHFVSINIFLFVFPIMTLALIARSPLPGYYKWPFIISLSGTLWMPIVTFLLILVIMYWEMLSTLIKRIIRKIRNNQPLKN